MRVILKERFWTKVLKTDYCWLWSGALAGKGYGNIWVDGKMKYAHRISYEWVKGPIPEGLELDHLCRVHNCVNPDHLEVVTRKENVRRGLGNGYKEKTHCKWGHPFSGDNLYIRFDGYRACKECQRIWGREFYFRSKK